MYRDYAIMQEAGAAAHQRAERAVERWGGFKPYLRPRRVMIVNADGPVDALGEFKYRKYLKTWNRQYVGSKVQWRSERNMNSEWRDWDGVSDPGTKGRQWRLVVTLRNGRVEHDAYFLAWRNDR